jgi:hypothetical protein
MRDALPTAIIASIIRWSDPFYPGADCLLPPFGESLHDAYQSRLERAGTRALLAMGIRELIPDGDDPASSDGEVERSALAFVQHLDDACGPSDLGLALATRFLAYTRGATTAAHGDLVLALSLVSARDFADRLEVWNPVCEQSIRVLMQHYQRTHAPREICEAELMAALGPYIRQAAVGSVIPALSRYLDHGRQIVGSIASLSVGALAQALLTEQTTYLVVDRDVRADARALSIDDALFGCGFGNVDHFLEYLFSETMVNDRLASAYAVSVRRRDEGEEPDVCLRSISRSPRPPLPMRLAMARAAMHLLFDEQPSTVDLLAAKVALIGSSISPAPLLVIGGDHTERREVFGALAAAVGIRVVTVNVAGLAELSDRWTQLVSMIATAGQPSTIDTSVAEGVIIVFEGLEALHVEAMPDLSSFEWHREHRLSAQRALATFLRTGSAEHGLFSTQWLTGPLWIVCCQAEAAPGWRHSRSGTHGEGLMPELVDCLQETVRLGPPSVRAMVSMLRQVFAEETTVRGEDAELGGEFTVTVPDATLWTAAHIARSRKASVRFARVVIEAAIRRSLLRREGPSGFDAIVVAPDDLTLF